MERMMWDLAVEVETSGYICITQKEDMMSDSRVLVHPDQVDLLIKWLNDAKSELGN